MTNATTQSRTAQGSRTTIALSQENLAFLKAMATVLRYSRPEDYAHDLVVRGLQEDARRIDTVFEQSSNKKPSGGKNS
jgi:hypothetical protein